MRLNTVKYLTTLVVIVGALQVNTALAQMDHGPEHQDMGQMQGGSAPADARDPHAYSDGYTLTEGPYAQPGPRQLKLADEHAFWSVLGDRLEYQEDSDSTVYDIQAWYGTTYNRFVIKAEGDIADGTLEESSTELLWGHALNAYFDTQFGVRLDQYDEGKDRQWLAIGMQGLAPYWFELDVTAYVGDDGRTALSAEAEYELLLTQRLILQPRAELNLYGKDDLDNRLGSGLSDLALGLRLRYEFSRQFSPYIGVEWTDTYGDTADYRRAAGEDTSGTQFVAGLRFWF
ncbi:MAG: copper resistance protein B [Pseudomonadales bacterium]|nr:copper resistance protein B [Pseudomonadales bacterium]